MTTGGDQSIAAPLGQAPMATPPTQLVAQPRHLGRVVLWMTGALLSFSVMAVSIRELAATLSIMEILVVRAASASVIIGSWSRRVRPLLRHDRRPPLRRCTSCATASISARNISGR